MPREPISKDIMHFEPSYSTAAGAVSLKLPNFLTTSQDVTKGADQAICVLQLYQVSINSDEKNNSFISNTFNGRSVR